VGFVAAIAADGDQRLLAAERAGAYAARHFQAVDRGQAQIQQHGLRAFAFDPFERGQAVVCAGYFEAFALEHHRQALGRIDVVINHQHTGHRRNGRWIGHERSPILSSCVQGGKSVGTPFR